MTEAFAQLRAAKVDGRTENVRYRQNELQRLHRTLRDHADTICEAIEKDAQSPRVEVDSEFYLGMLGVRDAYKSLDFSKELKDEYLIAKEKNNENRRVRYGIVLIRPTTHTRFFSIVAPLALAIAAGNCILLELPQTLSNLDSVLKNILSKVLDQDTFAIAKDEVTDKQLLGECLVVDQTGTCSGHSGLQLLSQPSAQTLAIVDRTADVEKAAKAIVAARFTYGGRSPYSPDIVLVNEFKKKDFFEACVRFTSQYVPAQVQSKRAPTQLVEETRNKFKTAESSGQVSIFGSQEYMIADVRERYYLKNCY
ncbi:MAG: hypothetical protein M1821_000492 [Bathelium mastoideum]|nr:MAG: hypothetical protein M1821_000492 [Bathelium mastoideum]